MGRFQTYGDHVVVMGDLVLLEDQVNPVVSAALDHGLRAALEQTRHDSAQPK